MRIRVQDGLLKAGKEDLRVTSITSIVSRWTERRPGFGSDRRPIPQRTTSYGAGSDRR